MTTAIERWEALTGKRAPSIEAAGGGKGAAIAASMARAEEAGTESLAGEDVFEERGFVPFYTPRPAFAAEEPGTELIITRAETPALAPLGALPLVAGAGALLFGGARIIAALAARMGIRTVAAKAILLNILKTAGLILMWEFVEEMLGVDRAISSQITEGDLAGRRKRFSIGYNPRVRTLQRVARHTQKLLKRHEKVIREFLPKRPGYRFPPPTKYLSAVEKKALRGG